MISLPGARLLAGTLAVVALLLPTAAHAGEVVVEDAVGDAEAWTDVQEFQFVPAPEEASVDITRTAASYAQHRLSVAVHFRDLEVRVAHQTSVRIWTPRGTVDVTVERKSARRATVSAARRGEAIRCRGLSGAYDGKADTVLLSVPAGCLGSPRWLRLGVKATATPRLDAENPGTVFFLADDGSRDVFRGGSTGKGPRIRRG